MMFERIGRPTVGNGDAVRPDKKKRLWNKNIARKRVGTPPCCAAWLSGATRGGLTIVTPTLERGGRIDLTDRYSASSVRTSTEAATRQQGTVSAGRRHRCGRL